MEKAPLDFVSIGDITTDAFIRIKDATVNCDVNRERCKLCLDFGDKIPYEFVEEARSVGNSPNAAVSATRLGLKTGLVTDVGDDHNGGECSATLQKNGVSLEFVTVHKSLPTNYHYVLWYEEERTILIKQQNYPYKLPPIEPAPRWIYLSSLAENSLPYHHEIAEYLKSHPETKLAFQPGTFQMKLGTEALKDLYKLSKIFFCNVEESQRILGEFETTDVKVLLKKMHSLGPEIVVITDGPKGAYAYDGVDGYFMPPYPDPKPPYERTGAGDAFASTFTAALALGKTIEEAIKWGPVNSMSVVQEIGAQKGLLTREKLEEYLANAPANYVPAKIM
ncbi:MAG TPA: carbohydrate kinase family protein [Candidatus Paceibacterota bacterium]|jgi:ribokinase|nr:carbohydrate kinase family protein [Candidatus Paceibacterota bacterium]